jgi:hypothetical protein
MTSTAGAAATGGGAFLQPAARKTTAIINVAAAVLLQPRRGGMFFVFICSLAFLSFSKVGIQSQKPDSPGTPGSFAAQSNPP